MTGSSDGLHRLAALAAELRSELAAAVAAGEGPHAEQLRGELALLEDLALPEAVSELRLQRIGYRAAVQAMERRVPPTLAAFLA